MVVTPREVKRLTPQEIGEVRTLEGKIDDTLKDGNLKFEMPPQTRERVLKEIMRKYRKAGWSVKYEPKMQGGDYLNFKERKKPRYYSGGYDYR